MHTGKAAGDVAGRLGRVGRFATRMYDQRRRFATGAAALLSLAIGYHVVFGQNGLTEYRQRRANAQELQRQAQDLERENDALKGHVERLANDPDAIEHQAREELHYTRPGEVIVTLPNEPAQAPRPADGK